MLCHEQVQKRQLGMPTVFVAIVSKQQKTPSSVGPGGGMIWIDQQ
jgi:hypothetical protein